MHVEINFRREITLDLYRRVAWQGQGLQLGGVAVECMKKRREEFLRLLDSDQNVTIYGVTTGYGHQASVRLDDEARRIHARRTPKDTVAASVEWRPSG